MRRLRIAAPSQLSLTLSSGEVPRGLQLWIALPDAAREQVLVLLAHLVGSLGSSAMTPRVIR